MTFNWKVSPSNTTRSVPPSTYVSHAVLVGFEPRTMDSVWSGPLGHLFCLDISFSVEKGCEYNDEGNFGVASWNVNMLHN
jgi:hypothetical protein